MRFSAVCSLLFTLPFGLASPTSTICGPPSPVTLQAVKNAFSSSGIVPSFIPSINPTLLLVPVYGSKPVTLGNEFQTTQTIGQPEIFLSQEAGVPANTTYSLFFINFDNPNPALPASAHLPFLHWQLSGLRPCAGTTGSSTVAFYIPLAPPSVAEDRYTFLVYREPKGYVPQPITSNARTPFNPTTYAAQGGLTLVGGNYLLEGQKNNVPPT